VTTILDGALTSVALCWQLERPDGAGLALTSHDRPLAIGGVAYAPSPGIVPAAVTRSLGVDSQTNEVAGALSTAALDEEDLALGRWDRATASLAMVDWTNLAAGTVALVAGELGEITIEADGFSAELRGPAARLDDSICPSTSPQCRAQFGDKKCRVDLAGRSARAAIVASDSGALTLDQAFDDRFLLGRLRYLSGANCGRSTVIIAVDGTTIQVRDLPRGAIEPGCIVELREGCDKRFQTCVERFANAANFRGEPHLPGADLLTRYPGA
jgi:uncharacterized phage protein (TIGR02218 family)